MGQAHGQTPAAGPAPERAASGRSAPGAGLFRRPQIDAQRQDAVDQLRIGIADHGEVREVPLGLLAEALAFWTLDRRHAARPDRFSPIPEPGHHLLRVEPGHGGQRRG